MVYNNENRFIGRHYMNYDKHKYWGFLGLISLIGLKAFPTENYWWCLFFVNFLWFTLFYENSWVYKAYLKKQA